MLARIVSPTFPSKSPQSPQAHSHYVDLLQAIAIMMMDAPTSLTDDSLRSNKVDLLKAMPPVDPANLVLGQYAAAKTGPREDGTGKAYVDDETVPDGSKTATFAQWAMQVDNARWKGVPVLVKCGKGRSNLVNGPFGMQRLTF
jgi:glucose-6-phosphate 1-dehydrogenase